MVPRGVVVCLLLSVCLACVEANVRTIFLKSAHLDTTSSPNIFDSVAHKQVRDFSPSSKWLVHLKGPVTQRKKYAVEAYLGYPLGQYFPQNTFMVVGPYEVARRAASAPHVLWVGAYLPEYKISEILQNWPPSTNGQFEENVFRVHLHESDERQALSSKWKESLQVQGINVVFELVGKTDLIAQTKSIPEAVTWLSQQHETLWMEPISTFRATNQWSTRITQKSYSASSPPYIHTFNLTGGGQTIALGDTAANLDSCFFVRPESNTTLAAFSVECSFLSTTTQNGNLCAGTEPHDHGTHVAASLIGSPQSAPLDVHTGHAPGASLYHINLPYVADPKNPEGVVITPPRSFFDYFVKITSTPARIILNSFAGTDLGYTLNNREIDDFIYSNQYLLAIFPAGNDGAKGPGGIGSPASAKNGLTVGSTQNDLLSLQYKPNPSTQSGSSNINDPILKDFFGPNVLATHSSRGPTSDGRIKPDVVAPGEIVYSASKAGCANTDNAVIGLTGTSMAAAAVAGAAALVRDYLARGFYGVGVIQGSSAILNPTAAQIKAVLINSGANLLGAQGPGYLGQLNKFLYFDQNTPNPYQGFGRVQLSNVLYFNGTNSKPFFLERNETKAVATGETAIYCFQASEGARIKATLVWSDVAAATSTSVALVNNLDLIIVERMTGREFRSNGMENFDDLNNVEQVEFVNNAGDGARFAAYVHGTNVPAGDGPQKFSLVISGANIDAINPTCTSALYRNSVCPNRCSSRGNCTEDGICNCKPGYFGVDCSLTPCPNNCGQNVDPQSRRGYCDFEAARCICDPRFYGSDCSQVKTGLAPIVVTTDTGLSTAVVAGAICGAVFGGIIVGIFLGWFIAVKTLESQRNKRREQLLRGQK